MARKMEKKNRNDKERKDVGKGNEGVKGEGKNERKERGCSESEKEKMT